MSVPATSLRQSENGAKSAFWWAVAAAVRIAVIVAVFLMWTLPANQATENWTRVPANWEALRRSWEWSLAVNAALMFAAFCVTVESVLSFSSRANG